MASIALIPSASTQNQQNAQRLPYYLWLALATLLCLSLTTNILLLFLSDSPQPNGLQLIVAIIGGMLITYPLLMLLTKDFFYQQFTPALRTSFSWSICSVGIGVMLALLIHWFSRQIPGPLDPTNTFDLIKQHSFLAELLLIIVVSIFAPFFEEYLFRGLILGSLAARFATFNAIFTSAVVFMGFHLIEYYDYWVGLLAVFCLGILLGWLKQMSRSMLAPILCHASYNFCIILLA
ncbi:CPBP family intramembrane glutamic endopeptidase [Kangiella shandongensis]|uniref:CPBP family intramembrane glutamic endopeptidase n=1 Tax=Kangiella shandongensis TaxID=2763258 RepID=UPI001CBBF8CC|nr:type II CAAX endopeptidase family protein [Kangiella shandongensis]